MAGSAEKVIDLLEAVARSAEPIGLMELAAAVGMDKSAASRQAEAYRKLKDYSIVPEEAVGP